MRIERRVVHKTPVHPYGRRFGVGFSEGPNGLGGTRNGDVPITANERQFRYGSETLLGVVEHCRNRHGTRPKHAKSRKFRYHCFRIRTISKSVVRKDVWVQVPPLVFLKNTSRRDRILSRVRFPGAARRLIHDSRGQVPVRRAWSQDRRDDRSPARERPLGRHP